MTFFISLFVHFSILTYFYLKPVRESIYNRCTHTMKSAGNLVSSTAEFSACMENGKYHFNCRNSCFMVDTYRYTSSVISDSNGIISIYTYINSITKSCQSFINRIVNNFIDKVMKTTAGSGSYIHTGTLSDSLETFQNLNLVSAIFMIYSCIIHRFFAH